ncbi:MAG: aspartate kinase [Planctomycetes bacterium]|nr:aspartate kinase [Planctomycetota bacterium]
MKFGGSSLANADRLRQVGELVQRARPTPCVVLSAMGDTTDRLFAIARQAGQGDGDAAANEVARLFADARAVADALLTEPASIAAELAQLERDAALLARGLGLAQDAARGADALVSHGERIATALLTRHLVERGCDVIAVDARDVIRTDATFGRARPDRGQIRQLAHQNIGPHVGRGTIVVTQGYIGRSRDGFTTTLGRGGSDWSAALLGAALGADEVQIWTDVEGVMTTDPRAVPEARPIASLSPEEAAELAAFGARVLHPSTIQPAVDRGIPVTVRHTMRPDGGFTRIASDCTDPTRGIAALASRGPITVVTMTSRRMLEASGYLAKLFEVFAELEVPVDLIATAEVSVAVTVEHDAPVARLAAALDGTAHVEVTEDCAIVAAIGDGLQNTERVLERACRALHPIEPRMVSFGGNSRNLSFVVRGSERQQALQRLHEEFFGGAASAPAARTASTEHAR